MLSRSEVATLMKSVFDECQATREAGQAEYAHKDENAFENFDSEAAALKVDRKVVWAVFAGKHWRGIRSYILGHKSQREDVRGRIKDLIVYLVLLWGMIDDEEHPTKKLSDAEIEKYSAMQNRAGTLGGLGGSR